MTTIKYYDQSYVIHDVGYSSIWSIGYPRTIIAFSVPDRVLTELEESPEWVAFDTLLEKYQEEDVQMQLQAEQERQERLSCIETSCPQPQTPLCESILQRIWGKVRKIVPFLRR